MPRKLTTSVVPAWMSGKSSANCDSIAFSSPSPSQAAPEDHKERRRLSREDSENTRTGSVLAAKAVEAHGICSILRREGSEDTRKGTAFAGDRRQQHSGNGSALSRKFGGLTPRM